MNQSIKRTSVWLPLIVAVAFVAGMLSGAYFFSRHSKDSALDKISTIMKYISSEYVDDVDTDSLLENQFLTSLRNLTHIPLTSRPQTFRPPTRNLTANSAE